MSEDVKALCTETNLDAVQRWAEARALDVVFPNEDELFIDIDNASDAKEFERNRDLIDSAYGILGVKVTPSRSGGTKKHYVVTIARKVRTPLERIALQAILGSDRRREANSLRRHILDGELTPTLFFEKKA